METRIIKQKVNFDELKKIASEGYGEMVKAVVDVDLGIMAVGGELHADESEMLFAQGSKNEDLWGINIYLDRPENDRLEYNSLINVKPSVNRSMDIQSPEIKEKIIKIVNSLIEWNP
ncbi:MAG: DUF5674 family protein [Candidatus Staskawiczbacteria bacterium]|nr:DUF5674 family protein [Candidatus Staskawiczbacteria bacterium]